MAALLGELGAAEVVASADDDCDVRRRAAVILVLTVTVNFTLR